MIINKLIDRDLTAGEIASIERFRSYTDGVSFACLKEGVMVMLHDEESKDAEKLREKALEHIDQTLSNHPDFNCVQMDDGYSMVIMPAGAVFSMSNEVCEGDEFFVGMALRGAALEACEDGTILAVMYEGE